MSVNVTIALVGTAAKASYPKGTKLDFTTTATSDGGTLTEHWAELQFPDGSYSWEDKGHHMDEDPFNGKLGGDGKSSTKTGSITLTELGLYHLRATATDVDPSQNDWTVSNTLDLVVADEVTPPPPLPPPPPPPGTGADPISVTVNDKPAVVGSVGDKLTLNTVEVYQFATKGGYTVKVVPPDPVVVPPATEGDWPMTAEAISARLGKRWTGGPEDRKKNPMSVTKDAPAGSDPRIAKFEFGRILPNWNNFWSTTFNGLLVRGDKVIPFRAQDFAAYAGAAATAARPDMTGFIPDPDLSWAPVDGTASCTYRSQAFLSNEALVGTLAGNITSLGTQTGRDPGTWRPVLNIPNFTITSICTTSENEIIIAVGFDPRTKKGKIAYVGAEQKYLASHTMQRMCQPGEGSWSWFKLLGVEDLPIDWPSSVTAASNGTWIGPSQTANQDLGQIDLSNPWTRKGMLDDKEDDEVPWGSIFATKAIVAVASKRAGKTVLIDLSKYILMIRQDYLTADDAKYQSIVVAESKGDYPPTFDEVPDNRPTYLETYDTPGVNQVLAVPKLERWSQDYWKLFTVSENGEMITIDVSKYLSRYSWQSVGPGGVISRTNLGGNVVHLTWGRYDDDWVSKPKMPNNGQSYGYCNSLVATVRDLRMYRYVYSFRELSGISGRDISSINGDDPIASYVNDRTNQLAGIYTNKIITFTIGGVGVPVVDPLKDQGWFPAVEGNGEGWSENPELTFPEGDFVLSGTDANVN